ncbi:glycoside hydrolase family 32 protein [Paenibacillus koleovorans]|uniref:glycoside hydrolase family 32 protein n=1 Tax=Paenibacillus koleovorans TaxID=121608 RepID=UPI000FD8DE7D|nr:glycoside hydrolase family 32 protein [Paenibacillus koleovorans]
MSSLKLAVTDRYMNLPVKNNASKTFIRFYSDESLVREFNIELTDGEPDFWVFSDLREYLGQTLEVKLEGYKGKTDLADLILLSDTIKNREDIYSEKYRPQLQFTCKRGWLNDPNGLVYYKGEYHLFYQHNPYGIKWGNMHWGHAVSEDLVHWEELEIALYPDELGTMFSGSAIVDHHNTTGFQTGEESPLVLIYTAAGNEAPRSKGVAYTQCLAYSNDRGRTWTKYEHNPVLGNIIGNNRDPKVLWHEPTQKWVMALYLDKNDFALLTSPDLKEWEKTCDIHFPNGRECPELFELPVDNDRNQKKWVFWEPKGSYMVGSFDGKTFIQESLVSCNHFGPHYYAAQTWSGIPEEDGRLIQTAWSRTHLPGMPFNSFLTFPCTLSLRTTPEGLRLCYYPVKEIEKLHAKLYTYENMNLNGEKMLQTNIEAELLDLNAEMEVGSASEIHLLVNGIQIVYKLLEKRLICQDVSASFEHKEGKVSFRVLVDRTAITIFGNGGELYMPVGIMPNQNTRSVDVFVRGGSARLVSMAISEMNSCWQAAREGK